MNLNKKEKGILECMSNKISPVTEFEVRFGLPIYKFGGDRNRISRKRFIEILRYLRDNYKITSSKTLLDIWFKNTNSFNSSRIRVTLDGTDAVSEYCKTDTFDPSTAEIIYKEDVFWSPKELDNMINDLRVWTEYEEGGRRKRDKALLDSDTGVRLSLKTEIPIVYTASGKNKFVVDPVHKSFLNKIENKWLRNKVYDELDQFQLYDRRTAKKFRYKRRFSFATPDGLFRYDLTMVKSSRRNSRNKSEYTKTFTSSRVLDGLEEYEIEMEYIGDKKEVDATVFRKSMMENMNNMLCLVYATRVPMSITEKNALQDEFKMLIVGNWVDRIDEKIRVLEADKGEHSRDIHFLNKKLKNYTYMRDGKRLLSDRVRLENTFIGPKPFTLELDNFGKDNPRSIEVGYSVTDKADGVRHLMYISGSGGIYYIDNRFNIRKCDTGSYKAPKELYQTVIDGEWVEQRSDGTPLNKFYAFDVYFNGGKSVEDLPLSGKSGRYNIMKGVFEKLEKGMKKKVHEHFWYKKFYFTDDKNDIFALSKECYEKEHEYNIDGLIFTPMHLPVGVDAVSETKYKLDKTSKQFMWNATSGSWRRALKWKPLEEQSIDFFVEFDTRDGKPVVLSQNVEIDGVEHTVRYKRLKLSVGANKMDKDLMNRMNPCMEVLGAVVSTKTGNYTVPMRFKPPFNSYDGIDTANIPITNKGKFVTVEGVKSGNILGSFTDTRSINIRNKSVVEFVYDSKAPDGFKWKVLRVREDKTEEYDRLVHTRSMIYRSYIESREEIAAVMRFEEGHTYTLDERNMINRLWRDCSKLFRSFGVMMRGNIYERVKSLKDAMSFSGKSIIRSEDDIPIHFTYGNYYTTAHNVWNAINNPVTRTILFEGETVPLLDDDKYYRSTIDRDDDPTARMRKYHNRIKTTLIQTVASGKSSPTLLDLCCGKAGDLYKWRGAGVTRVLGVDVSRDNIYNRSDGACVRYMNMVRKAGIKSMEVDFLVGDCGSSMENLEAFTDERSSNYYRDTFLDMNGKPLQFDIVSTQFAIHYFFNTRSRVDSFLRNVSVHLKNGGFFIGTSLDGDSVYKKLCKSSSDEVSKTDKNSNLVWSIKRNFDKCGKDFYDKGKHPTNYEIEIRLPSITGEGTSYKEWLVNFDYLKKRAREHKLVLYKYKGGGISGSNLFDRLYDPKDVEMTPEERDLSFMYRYFIFRKEV